MCVCKLVDGNENKKRAQYFFFSLFEWLWGALDIYDAFFFSGANTASAFGNL